MDWSKVTAAPAFIINMPKCVHRRDHTMGEVIRAGFHNFTLVPALDASNVVELRETWEQRGLKPNPIDPEFTIFPGKQGCLFSHLRVLDYIVNNKLELSVIFEDDITFHPHFQRLAPLYMELSPDSFDILYLGSQLIQSTNGYVSADAPVWCAHAMVFSLAGARKLRDFIVTCPGGVYTLDTMIKDAGLETVVWNGTFFPSFGLEMSNGWDQRNTGLVFQDQKFGSFIKAMY